jgi:hypothetical protein
VPSADLKKCTKSARHNLRSFSRVPSPFSSTDMLSSLPPELLRDIVEATVPHTFHSRTFKDRQRTLCSISLVSKLFCSIAQPLLLEIVRIESIRRMDTLASMITEGGGGTRRPTGVRCAVFELYHNSGFERLLPELCWMESLTVGGSGDEQLDVSLPSSLASMSYCYTPRMKVA